MRSSTQRNQQVPGRRATDNYILTQELLHFIHHQRGKTNFMAAKIDLEKAYHKSEWSFIKYILMFYHFSTPIIELIMTCISSSSISLLWNREVSVPFRLSRGIRKGDPLSRYLFILCLNHLSLSLNRHSILNCFLLFGLVVALLVLIISCLYIIFSCLPRRISRSV